MYIFGVCVCVCIFIILKKSMHGLFPDMKYVSWYFCSLLPYNPLEKSQQKTAIKKKAIGVLSHNHIKASSAATGSGLQPEGSTPAFLRSQKHCLPLFPGLSPPLPTSPAHTDTTERWVSFLKLPWVSWPALCNQQGIIPGGETSVLSEDSYCMRWI